MDEPMVGLDPEERLHFCQLMAKLGQDRIIVLSTHIVADLGSDCSDTALIDHGKVEFRGSPTELMSRAKRSVFEERVSLKDEAEVTADLEVVSREEKGNEVLIRAVSTNGGLPQARSLWIIQPWKSPIWPLWRPADAKRKQTARR